MSASNICDSVRELQAEGAELDRVLTTAVELLHESNARFHWTGIYELCVDDVLRLGPFVGSPTDHSFIAMGQGICGTALAERRNINVPDVAKARSYLACSAATKSELVVLIQRGGRIYGQIDIDSHEENAFDDEAVQQVQQVADCLAEVYRRWEHRRV